jgi:osmotically-inducible protein OsmY
VKRVYDGLLALAVALGLLFAATACDNTARGLREDAAKATETAKDTADAAKAEAKEEAADARAAGREAASDAAKTAAGAGAALDAAKETIDVKTALMADDTVDASDINVDTFHETKTVVLKGTVRTTAQKDAAGKIAAREAVGYKIDNQLTVKVK